MEKKWVLNENCQKFNEKNNEKCDELESQRSFLYLEIVDWGKKSKTDAWIIRRSKKKKNWNQ